MHLARRTKPTPSPSRLALRALRGTVMMELCLVMPLLFLLLSFLFFFGRALMRVQFAKVADRYVAWEQASGRAPAIIGNDALTGTRVGEAFYAPAPYFDANAGPSITAAVNADSTDFPADAANDLTQACQTLQTLSPGASDVATQVVADFPNGISVNLDTTYTSSIKWWQLLEQPIKHTHVRPGNDWKFVNQFLSNPANTNYVTATNPQGWSQVGSSRGPWMLGSSKGANPGPVNQTFFTDLDGKLSDINNPVANYLLSIYSGKPGYAGPNF